ncbi:MAG: hypothetical protein K2G75_01205, partial [Muribaculaceae bacterium]|nr:hypothetical protein [Muribaculaceae bacterium]
FPAQLIGDPRVDLSIDESSLIQHPFSQKRFRFNTIKWTPFLREDLSIPSKPIFRMILCQDRRKRPGIPSGQSWQKALEKTLQVLKRLYHMNGISLIILNFKELLATIFTGYCPGYGINLLYLPRDYPSPPEVGDDFRAPKRRHHKP